jgi:acetyltransferase
MIAGSGPAPDPPVSGPRLVADPGPDAVAELAALWLAVTRTGGAVGFVQDAPAAELRAAAAAVIDDVRAGRQQLFEIRTGTPGVLAGTVFLRRGVGTVFEHRADVLRLMVHPDLAGRGWGRALLTAAVEHAASSGLELLLLSTRGGTGLPALYARLGWTRVGVVPGGLRLAPDDARDEHLFFRRL